MRGRPIRPTRRWPGADHHHRLPCGHLVNEAREGELDLVIVPVQVVALPKDLLVLRVAPVAVDHEVARAEGLDAGDHALAAGGGAGRGGGDGGSNRAAVGLVRRRGGVPRCQPVVQEVQAGVVVVGVLADQRAHGPRRVLGRHPRPVEHVLLRGHVGLHRPWAVLRRAHATIADACETG